MAAQVPFGHRCDRMVAHRRVAVDAIDLPVVVPGEQIPEDHVPSQRRRADDGWYVRGREVVGGEFDGPADVTDLGGGVER